LIENARLIEIFEPIGRDAYLAKMHFTVYLLYVSTGRNNEALEHLHASRRSFHSLGDQQMLDNIQKTLQKIGITTDRIILRRFSVRNRGCGYPYSSILGRVGK
jgi:hypothetical protein